MGPAKRSRYMSKHLFKGKEDWNERDKTTTSKTKKRKRKLSDMLGSQWSKEELEHFYEAYRKYGKDWKKVVAAIPNRSSDMVEAIYNMNRAYLSLPEGTATAAGLIAMMTDHYSILDGSNSDGEGSQEVKGSHKTQKLGIGKLQLGNRKGFSGPHHDYMQTHSAPSDSECLSLLRKKHSGDIFDGTRPRAVGKRTPRFPVPFCSDKSNLDKCILPSKSSVKYKYVESEMTKNNCTFVGKDGGSVTATLQNSRSACSFKDQKNAKRRKDSGITVHQSDVREACTGIKGLDVGKIETNERGGKNSQGFERLKQWAFEIFTEDENSALCVLQSFVDMSANSELHIVDVESGSARNTSNKSKISVEKERLYASGGQVQADSHEGVKDVSCPNECSVLKEKPKTKRRLLAEEVSVEEEKPSPGNHLVLLSNQENQIYDLQYSLNTDHQRAAAELSESDSQVPTINNHNMPARTRSRRKANLCTQVFQSELKTCDRIEDTDTDESLISDYKSTAYLKEKLPLCLSFKMLRRWCAYEWFYSAIDYPWFARNDFVEYLNHVKMGHIPRLTRAEWSIIRSSLGKPRRFSKKFLLEEREKLEQYRKTVRRHYDKLRTGMRDGLPTDLARPLSVGQQIIARHPRTGELYDGKILTVDLEQCKVQFDRPDLGVEFVMDIDCMPLDPLENMPEDLVQSAAVNESMGSGDCTSLFPSSKYTWNKKFKDNTGDATVGAESDFITASQRSMYYLPWTLTQLHEREAAVAEFSHALQKKEDLVSELKHMNTNAPGKNCGDTVLNPEQFREKYATILSQLQEASNQVTSALRNISLYNTTGDSTVPWLRPVDNSGHVRPNSFINYDHFGHDIGSNVSEIVESSMLKAKQMVEAAIQEMSFSWKRMEVLVSKENQQTEEDFHRLGKRYSPLSGSSNSASQSKLNSGISDLSKSHEPTSKEQYIATDAQFPTELISSCISTFLMIKMCAQRQYPPAEIAWILEHAVARLQPCCSQNLPIYCEIETFMSIIKNQMLALLPSTSFTHHAEVSV
ncbi:protein ALWAYS EARLY 3-like isoform X1 [Typha latifolia]|uniref:protein ALWAYS EARLY 3-like isoform X1 n=1 Tax=Typha latifolia TaxID=4733 RepID=UPI003C2CD8E1